MNPVLHVLCAIVILVGGIGYAAVTPPDQRVWCFGTTILVLGVILLPPE